MTVCKATVLPTRLFFPNPQRHREPRGSVPCPALRGACPGQGADPPADVSGQVLPVSPWGPGWEGAVDISALWCWGHSHRLSLRVSEKADAGLCGEASSPLPGWAVQLCPLSLSRPWAPEPWLCLRVFLHIPAFLPAVRAGVSQAQGFCCLARSHIPSCSSEHAWSISLQ